MSLASVDDAEGAVDNERKRQKSKDVTNQQSPGVDGVSAEIESGEQYERCGNAGRPCRATSGPFAKEFIETCNSIVLGDNSPNECSEQHMGEMPLRRIENGSV